MRLHSWLLFLFITTPCVGEAISWNPWNWFTSEQPKKIENNFYKSLQTSLQVAHKMFKQETAFITQYARKHPQQLIAGGCLLAAVVCMRSFAKLHATLQKNDAWAHWKHDVCLVSTKYDAHITHELLHEIQIRYLKLHAITDFMGPIRSFMADITTEKAHLQRYARYARLLQSCGLYCCVDTELMIHIDEKIERLETLKALCLRWLAKTKLDPVLT